VKLLITTPTAVAVDETDVASVRAEDESGSFGLLDGHADLVTALKISVVSWKRRDGASRYCGVRHGVLSISGGRDVAIATREAVVSDNLDHLEDTVLAGLRDKEEAERAERTASLRLEMNAIRQLVRSLRQRQDERFTGMP